MKSIFSLIFPLITGAHYDTSTQIVREGERGSKRERRGSSRYGRGMRLYVSGGVGALLGPHSAGAGTGPQRAFYID